MADDEGNDGERYVLISPVPFIVKLTRDDVQSLGGGDLDDVLEDILEDRAAPESIVDTDYYPAEELKGKKLEKALEEREMYEWNDLPWKKTI